MFSSRAKKLSDAVGGFLRQHVKFTMLLMTLITGILLVGQSRSKTRTVEAERFLLKGPDGSVRAKLEASGDSTEFSLYNRAGNVGVALTVSSKGDGLEMRDDSGRVLVFMGVGLISRSSTIDVVGKTGGPALVLDADQDAAVVKVVDATGHSVWLATSRPHPGINH